MIIKDQKTLDIFCAEIRAHPFITIDTEFLREKTYYPKLCLVQLGDPKGHAAAIDPLEGDFDLTPLYKLLFDKDVLKVFHAARQDLEIFYHLTGKVVQPFFDTQIAAMVCGYGDSVGYESLVRNITGHKLDKSVQFTNWSNRPLSQKQIDYALGDVTHLVQVYKQLAKELENRGRTSWLYQEEEILSDPASYENAPDDTWRRIKLRSPRPKTLAILRELAAWRETRAQKRNVPRAWILRDDTLADMAAQAPKNPNQLKKIRNIPQEIAGNDIGQTLLGLIEKAENSDKKTWPKLKKKKPPSSTATAIVNVLKLLLKVQSAEHEVASKLIASKEDLEILATEKDPDIPALKGWRYEIFGKEAMELKKGHLAIGMKGANITKYKISGNTKSRN